MSNRSSASDFLLLEFSEIREMQILYSFVFLLLYLAVVSGNLLIISAIALDHHLHTPMYFFLMNLAMQDLGQVSVIIPKSMANSLMNTRHISYSGCVAQVFLIVFFVSSDFFFLTVMAYDRYVAICNPLHYELVMNKLACLQMVVTIWLIGLLYAALHTCGTFASPFCSNAINQFFCEIPALIQLVCSDLYLIEIGAVIVGMLILLSCFVFIVVSYVHIFTAVLRIPSAKGRQKAFSTCLPHLTVVCTVVSCGTFAYLGPTSSWHADVKLLFTVIYSIVPPTMNPVIYSMRNKEIKNAMSKLLFMRNSAK